MYSISVSTFQLLAYYKYFSADLIFYIIYICILNNVNQCPTVKYAFAFVLPKV